MNKEINSLLKQINKARKEHSPENSLVSNCFYLKDGNILAMRNPDGDSRYPYSVNGLTLWAYSSGNIVINQSNYFLSPLTVEGKEPYFNIYAGLKNKKGQYDIYSILGNADQQINEDVYTVFNEKYCYYIRKIKGIIFAAKLTISKDEKILVSTSIINKNKKDADVLVSFYFNPLMIHSTDESEETKWFRTIYNHKDYSTFVSVEDISREIHLYSYLVLKNANNADSKEVTSRRMDYVGDKNRSIALSKSLIEGHFNKSLPVATFVDMAAYGDILKKNLKKEESLISNYQMSILFKKEELSSLESEEYSLETNEKHFNEIEKSKANNLKISFGKLDERYPLNNVLFNSFLKSVIRQVDYCTKTKNSSLMLLGIRDVYQMMEASLLWDKKQVRKKIIESLSYLDISGRAPRQYSKETEGSQPLFDNREFIDQGQWIISAIHRYLAFTNDFSILKEKCGYYELIGRKGGNRLSTVETIYDHLIRIINFLISNIDPNTNCLRALYGDWNDAVDGLGSTTNKDEQFGNGVSVMASEHLYRNLIEMFELVKAFKGEEHHEYLELAKKVEDGILKNAIVKGKNEERIVHGWGENKSFYVGSFKDVDNKSRHSSTSNSFFVISGLYEKHPELKDAILDAYKHLDSKYGLKTFDEYFAKEDAYKVGRIVNLPKGTAENAATYIHAGMFFVRALFKMNEGQKAFDQIYKLIPITHEKISTSPFVMPNSYGENPELGIDGESMSDWYTGSSNTFLKSIVFDLFGINPDLVGKLYLKPSNYFPSDEASISLDIRNKKVTIEYQNEHRDNRKIFVNDKLLDKDFIDLNEYSKTIQIKIVD